MSDVSRILVRINSGDPDAANELFQIVYDELRRMAKRKMAHEPAGHTLQTTSLVHEAYLRLVGSGQEWKGKNYFFVAAAESMRRILVDRARRRQAAKRGGGIPSVPLVEDVVPDEDAAQEIVAVHEGLTRLQNDYPQHAELVVLRYFGGMSLADAASALGLSRSTANRYWAFAKAWLKTQLEP